MDKNQIMSMLPKVADLLEQQELKMLCKMKGRNRVTNILREYRDHKAGFDEKLYR